MPSAYVRKRWAEIAAEQRRKDEARLAQPRPRTPKAEPIPVEGYVYFFRTGNEVKIGFSTNPAKRQEALRVACPAQGFIAKLVKGSTHTERYFHDHFAEYHLRGEWFDLRGRLAKYLEMCLGPIEMPAPGPRPVVEERVIEF